MFHQGFAAELARVTARDRADTSVGTPASAWVHPSPSSFERALSSAGAIALLALVILGPAGAAVLAAVVATGVWLARRGLVRHGAAGAVGPAAPESSDRWRAWRVHEPDPEYLRRRAA